MGFDVDRVPEVVKACVLLFDFMLAHESVGKDEVFTDNAPTRLGRGTRGGGGASRG